MRPRVVGFAAAFIVLVTLLFLARYNSRQQQQQQLGSPSRKDNAINHKDRSFTWFDNLKRSLSELVGFPEEGDEIFQPVKQGNLNYMRRYANSVVNSVVSVTVSPSTTTYVISRQQSNITTDDSRRSSSNIINNLTQVQQDETPILMPDTDNQSNSSKLKQLDLLSTYRMNREAIGGKQPSSQGEEAEEVESMRNVKCQNSKYDRLIAQKISMNDISRPIITSDGRFDNPFPTWNKQSLVDVVKFIVWEADDSGVPKNKDELDKELGPMIKPYFSDLLQGQDNSEFRATWIGHATLLIQVDGYNILTDPMFSERASFTQFFGPKRIRQPACDIKSLPHIDIVLISHNHYDHLDASSVKELNDRFGRSCRWVVPLGIGEFLKSMSVENYVELDWWQKDCFLVDTNSNTITKSVQSTTTTTINNNLSSSTIQARSILTASPANTQQVTSEIANGKSWNQRTQRPELDIYLTPSQHWSRRGVNDVNKSLWGSFTIANKNGSTFFFGGDTAYCSAFKEIGKVFGPFTGAAIPIGAYKPRWFLKTSHVDPHEAVQIHRDLRSMKSIGIHHSTFILSNENYREPANLLKEIMSKFKAIGLVKEPFITLKHGETTQFCKKC